MSLVSGWDCGDIQHCGLLPGSQLLQYDISMVGLLRPYPVRHFLPGLRLGGIGSQ